MFLATHLLPSRELYKRPITVGNAYILNEYPVLLDDEKGIILLFLFNSSLAYSIKALYSTLNHSINPPT